MNKSIFIIAIIATFFCSCEDVIDVKLNPDKKELVVDAVITNQPGVQTIRLSQTIGYFDDRGSNPPIIGATVILLDADSFPYFFTESGPGRYVYPDGADFNRIGENYGLIIITGLDTFLSISNMAAAANIDTILWEKRPATSFSVERYEAEFMGNDLVGLGNTYWIRTYKNDSFLGKPSNINIAYDASFSPGANYDGIEFIVPIRRLNLNDGENPYRLNDKITVEILGISNEFFLFLRLAAEQINNQGLFATPPANVPSNIINQSRSSKNKANGFFVIGESKIRTAIITE